MPGGTRGPSSVPVVTQCCGDVSGPCPSLRVTRCHRELGCASVVPHGQRRGGLSGGRCHHPWVPSACRAAWQGSAGITTALWKNPV